MTTLLPWEVILVTPLALHVAIVATFFALSYLIYRKTRAA